MYNYCIAAYCSTIIRLVIPQKAGPYYLVILNSRKPQYIFTVRPYKVPRATVTKAVT